MKNIMETKSLIIRDTIFLDYKYFAEWENDQEIIKFLSINENKQYEEVVREGLENSNDPTKIELTAVDRDTETPIGRIQITRLDDDFNSLDITKYYIGDKSLWGKGLAAEILKQLLEYCFTFLRMERITLDFYTGNKRAEALYEKLGFKKEGVARHAAKKDGRYFDLHLMSLLRNEFFENQGEED